MGPYPTPIFPKPQIGGQKATLSNFSQPVGGQWNRQQSTFLYTLTGREVMQWTIVQFLSKSQISESRSSIMCVVVERPDHHCVDDLILLFISFSQTHLLQFLIWSPLLWLSSSFSVFFGCALFIFWRIYFWTRWQHLLPYLLEGLKSRLEQSEHNAEQYRTIADNVERSLHEHKEATEKFRKDMDQMIAAITRGKCQ